MDTAMQAMMDEYKKVRADTQSVVTNITQLQSQLNENSMVKEEIDEVKDGEPVYKLVGPVLVRQDVEEVKSLVTRRIGLIKSELAKAEARAEELRKKEDAIKDKVMAHQKATAASTAARAASGSA
ncbi:hypothetical protein FNF27_00764 [Cafeteria roenbergensis]|uniref:Prefoldin subunit 6 n=2 Tax=Cafeteria roenbergensis TaxID=33653 RepID=A0A5A8EK10_CAFRO|nr:hypothetical protein FNF29_01013 [Cafeteria roenbergensis]KAA0160956.1 hypothetical protein FNF31_04028 [Cafeteria roenbergensis]KAA0164582.1 hypothetical protein FNF28_03824 [Cafeteria roenbergensis]KAA0177594.1 hypothetical protein FNF27_00764 [Cafeteria roenbergensis]|eukprot:KAA0156223.1 hypothetical protein FNF29_01013 [Cafeteria roenbergensis]